MCQEKLVERIKTLQKIPYFNNVDSKYLMPIALNLVPKYYRLGEYLVKKGQIPPGLLIIVSGQCSIVNEKISQRYRPEQTKKQELTKINPRKFGIIEPILQEFDPDTTILNQVNGPENSYQGQRVLVSKTGKEIKDKWEYNDIMKFKELMPGNYFGARTLLPYEHYSNLKRLFMPEQMNERYYPPGVPHEIIDAEADEHYHLKSMLSVVSNSARVKVWTLNKSDMNYLPDKVLKQVFESIS